MNDLLIYLIIGSRIRDIREGLGLTQAELADQIGDLTRTSITQIESGKQRVQVHQLYKIAEILNVPIYALIPPNDSYDGITIREKFLEFVKQEYGKGDNHE